MSLLPDRLWLCLCFPIPYRTILKEKNYLFQNGWLYISLYSKKLLYHQNFTNKVRVCRTGEHQRCQSETGSGSGVGSRVRSRIQNFLKCWIRIWSLIRNKWFQIHNPVCIGEKRVTPGLCLPGWGLPMKRKYYWIMLHTSRKPVHTWAMLESTSTWFWHHKRETETEWRNKEPKTLSDTWLDKKERSAVSKS